ncbi:MAG: hypothetical protein ABIO61_03535 [Thermomonas sp.]
MDLGNRIPLFLGVADDMLVRYIKVEWSPTGTDIEMLSLGTASFFAQFPPELKRRFGKVLVSTQDAGLKQVDFGRAAVVNYVADSDLCGGALDVIEGMVDRGGGPCFNHPARVRLTRRHHISKRLSKLPGLVVPRTALITASDPDDLIRQVDAAGISWPVILRVPGSHGGRDTALAVSAADVPRALYSIPVGGKPLYVTAFHDFRDADGLFRKLRLVVVGRRVFARHFVTGAGWSVHAGDRLEGTSETEDAILDGFPGSLAMDIEGLALRVADTLGLDWFGIDCCPRPDGSLLIFEANAAMDVLANTTRGDPGAVRRISVIHSALVELLLDASRWRHQGGNVSP